MSSTSTPSVTTQPAATSPRLPRAVLRRPSVLAALALLLLVAAVWSVTLVRARQPQTLDERSYAVASQLQCPICHGESVADSPSPLAQEMRSLIRQKLAQGESEQQVVQYFHARYGDAILEAPPLSGFTLLIWLGPVVMLALGLLLLRSVAAEMRTLRFATAGAANAAMPAQADDDAVATLDLSDDERARYLALLRRELADDEGLGSAPTDSPRSGRPAGQPGKAGR